MKPSVAAGRSNITRNTGDKMDQFSLEFMPSIGDPEANALYQTQTPEESMLNALYPVNLRQLVASTLGQNYDITNQRFTPEDLAYMRHGYEMQKKEYQEHPLSGQSFEDYRQQNALRPPNQEWPAWYEMPQFIWKSYTDPQTRLAPFMQGAYYDYMPEGVRLRNEYVYSGNDDVSRDVNVLLPY